MLNWLKKQFTSTDKKSLTGIESEHVSVRDHSHENSNKKPDHKILGDLSYKEGKLLNAIHQYRLALLNTPTDPILFNKLGDVFYDQQDYVEAEKQYRRALDIKSDFIDAELNLGLCLDSMQRFAEALTCYQNILKIEPDNYLALFNLAVTQSSIGNVLEACSAYLRVLELKPGFIHANFNLAILFQRQGNLDEAEAHYLAAISANPNHFEAYCNLGIVHQEKEEFALAQECLLQALRINPKHAETQHNLGLVKLKLKQNDTALMHFRHAVDLRPDFVEALVGLGDACKELNRLGEAEENYRKAIMINPKIVGAYCNLGSMLHQAGRYEEAVVTYQQGIANGANPMLLYNNLGTTYSKMCRYGDAETCFSMTLQIAGSGSLAGLFGIPGKIKASENSRRTEKFDPQYAQVFGNLLFMLNYDPDRSAEEIFAAYQEYEELYANRYRNEWTAFNNNKNRQRRLKIGYVSPDFRLHPVQHFLEPLMEHHNKEIVEVYAYAENALEDAVTNRYKRYADYWIPTNAMSDIALCERIKADGIDILVDLAGHTANNRLSVFARKAAPVQVSWLGFGYTTGLTAIDYFLTDNASAPPGSESLYAEQLWRLPTSLTAYRPAQGMGDVSSLPALKNGYITIGTLTRSIRVNYKTIRVWAEILKRLENARLVIDSANYQFPEFRQSLIEKFTALGIDESRLEIGYHSPAWDVLRSMDIGLDCFPHNSGTTLFETLYMGVPFVTLAGKLSVGRLGKSILDGLGRPEWVTYSEKDYVDKVVALATDVDQLAKLRAGLREEIQKSVLMDESGFASKVEDAYQSMWAKWCDS